jgi:hypothetical protein
MDGNAYRNGLRGKAYKVRQEQGLYAQQVLELTLAAGTHRLDKDGESSTPRVRIACESLK